MGDTADLWTAMNEIKERVTRIEERSSNRDEKISEMAGKVTDMHTFFLQSQGGFKTASVMAKFAYGTFGAIGMYVMSNLQMLKKLF